MTDPFEPRPGDDAKPWSLPVRIVVVFVMTVAAWAAFFALAGLAVALLR